MKQDTDLDALSFIISSNVHSYVYFMLYMLKVEETSSVVSASSLFTLNSGKMLID